MTKLSHDNLDLNHFRDCLFEQEDHRFLNSINSYLEQFRQRLLAYFTYMKSDIYREHLRKQLDNEMEINNTLKAKVNCLENNIKALLEDAIHLLKLRTNELGIEELDRPVQLITYANDISNKHKELRSKVATLEKEIAEYDHENEKINLILNNIHTNDHQSSTTKQLSNDNTYSTLLVNMSKQTQQQENKSSKTNQLSYLPLSPNSTVEKQFDTNRFDSISSCDTVKSERKTDFIIQKRAKKSPNLNSDGNAIVSPIKIIKVTDKRIDLQGSLPPPPPLLLSSSTVAGSIDNLLSTKQLEPVQVHSVVSKGGHQLKQEKFLQQSVVQTVNVKTLINTSPTSLSKPDDIRFVAFLIILFQ
jgi:hypothetical protein